MKHFDSQEYELTMEVCDICNHHADELRNIAENKDIFRMCKKDIPKPKKRFRIMLKERTIIIMIALSCLVLAVQHVVLTLTAYNNGQDNLFYAGWQKEDAIVCMLMVITIAIDYVALLVVQRQERRLAFRRQPQ